MPSGRPSEMRATPRRCCAKAAHSLAASSRLLFPDGCARTGGTRQRMTQRLATVCGIPLSAFPLPPITKPNANIRADLRDVFQSGFAMTDVVHVSLVRRHLGKTEERQQRRNLPFSLRQHRHRQAKGQSRSLPRSGRRRYHGDHPLGLIGQSNPG